MEFSLVIYSFIAGLLTFLAPCTFPLVPGYLGFISGVSLEDLKDPVRALSLRRKIFFSGIFFALGFSAVFVSMGTLAGFVGAQFLAPYRVWLGRIGGIFVIIFGLLMLRAIRIPFLLRERRLSMPTIFERGRPINSFIFGSTFALGWTPCVGPILGSIYFLAAASHTAWQGAFLLSVFSAGLAIPFLFIAAGVSFATKVVAHVSRYLNVVSAIGGLFLVFLGALIAIGKMNLFISYSYRFLQFINYEQFLLDYL